MIRFASLGSGSAGNALLVESGAICLMVDCGFGLRETVARMHAKGRQPTDLAGILVTHEHGDHMGGVCKLARKYALPVWMTHGTWVAAGESDTGLDLRIIDSHLAWNVNGIGIQPFPVPHDAREPVQFVFSVGNRRLGVLTDIGEITPHVFEMLSECHGLLLECNHDAEMLARSAYPRSLKDRISGRYGHLDNGAAANLLAGVSRDCLQHLVLAHLSERNNTPQLARASLSTLDFPYGMKLDVATADTGFDWREII